MSSTIDVRVPDIGDFKDIPVIEVFVKPGDAVKKNDSLVTLESDKAAMEVPSSADGSVVDVKVKIGDKVSEGSVIVTLESTAAAAAPQTAATLELVVPDVGDFNDIPVTEVLIKPGDKVEKETSLVVLESDKASMEVPSTAAGTIVDVKLKVGDKVSKGTVIATLSSQSAAPSPRAESPRAPAASVRGADPVASVRSADPVDSVRSADPVDSVRSTESVHASPSVRRFARELGVALQPLRGSGPNGRITREDVQRYVKSAMQGGEAPSGGASFAGLPAWPKVDFASYGEIERVPLSRIKRLSGPNLHRNWVQVPHITNYDEADVTDLESFRSAVNAERAKGGGGKLTMLAFLVRASVAALQRFPDFNSSLDGGDLVQKKYYNIGFAADTPSGLVVPVVKNAQNKGLLDIAQETAELAGKARDGKLALGDMQGGTFTISSIGGIGGTAFTQIVNAPEVAILGAVRAAMKPVWNGKEFTPRLVLPLSVSYDHRVIDGASAARFLVYLAGLLGDFRRVLL